MPYSKLWVNESMVSYPNQRKDKLRKRRYARRRKVDIPVRVSGEKGKRAQRKHTASATKKKSPSSFLDTLQWMTAKMDLNKFKSQLSDLKMFIQQVNGVIKDIQQQRGMANQHKMNPHPYPPPYPIRYPVYQPRQIPYHPYYIDKNLHR